MTFVEGTREFKYEMDISGRGSEKLRRVVDGEDKVLRDTGGGPRVIL